MQKSGKLKNIPPIGDGSMLNHFQMRMPYFRVKINIFGNVHILETRVVSWDSLKNGSVKTRVTVRVTTTRDNFHVLLDFLTIEFSSGMVRTILNYCISIQAVI